MPTPVGGISTDRPAASTSSAARTSGPPSKISPRSSSITRATRSSSRPTTSSASRRSSATTTSSSKTLQGVNADPREGTTRNDHHLGIQAAFIDKHLRNVSDNYDFDSFRIGIQPFSSDFRGFLFQDNQLGAALVRHARQQSLAVQHRVLPPPREGHEQRLERSRAEPARRRRVRREHLPAGFSGHRLHVAADARLQPQPRERRGVLQPERLHRAAVIARARGAARVRRRLHRLQRRRSLRSAEHHDFGLLRDRRRDAGRVRPGEGRHRRAVRRGGAVDGLRLDPAAHLGALRQRRRRSVRRSRRRASMRSSRIRSSPAPTTATGFARPCR